MAMTKTVTIPELAMIAGTRAALGAGIALLLADRLSNEQRRAVGWTLVAVGVLTTIPLAAQLLPSGPRHVPTDRTSNGHEPAREEAGAGM